MSFRRRGEIIGAPGSLGRTVGTSGTSSTAGGRVLGGLSRGQAQAQALGRAPLALGKSQATSAGVGTNDGRGLLGEIRGQEGQKGPKGPFGPSAISQTLDKNQELERLMQNPGIKPSIVTSQPTISTGSVDLDKILLHQGLPLGSSLLIEETTSTDFSTVLLRCFASQGIIHNRIDKEHHQIHCHVVVVGFPSNWANELPGVYKGSFKEQKKAKIAGNESKLSVSNLSQLTAASSRPPQDLKIAWRYGLHQKNDSVEENPTSAAYEHYNCQFDITQKLLPGPGKTDISFVPMTTDYIHLINTIKNIIDTETRSNPFKTIRLVIPSILHPMIYNPDCSRLTFMVPFMHSLRSLLRTYSTNLVVMASISTDLYPRESQLTNQLEALVDSVIQLQPFNQEMSQLLQRAYKNDPTKIQHGFVHIHKIPVLSERGLMLVHDGEYAFKNGRRKFEIEEWGIPVEDESNDGESQQQTSKNVDF